MGATFSLAYRGSLDPDHILYVFLSGSTDTCQVRLRSRRLLVPAEWNLLDNLARLGISSYNGTFEGNIGGPVGGPVGGATEVTPPGERWCFMQRIQEAKSKKVKFKRLNPKRLNEKR